MEYTAFAARMRTAKGTVPVYLFFGTEAFLRRRALACIEGAEPAFRENGVRVSSSETRWPKLLTELCSQSLTGERKLVHLVDDGGNFVHNESSNLLAYLASPSSCSVLVLDCPVEKCPLPMETKNLLAVSCAPLRPSEAAQWAATEAQRRGKAMDRRTAEVLVARAGTDLAKLDHGLESLALHAGSRGRIELADVESLIPDDSEHEVYELALACARRARGEGLRILHRLLGAGENAAALVWRLAWQYRKMVEAKGLLEGGVRRFEVPSRLQITYYADKFLALVDAHGRQELLDKHQALLDADGALKSSGSGVEMAILDALICRLCREAAPVG